MPVGVFGRWFPIGCGPDRLREASSYWWRGPALGYPVPGDAPSPSWGSAKARSVAPGQATLVVTCLLQVGSQDPAEDTWLPSAGWDWTRAEPES